MTSLRDIRVAIAGALASVGIDNTYDTWPAQIMLPAAIVRPLTGDYHQDFNEHATLHLEVTVLLQISTIEIAQEEMDAYMATDGDRSVMVAIEADPGLSGAADSVTVTGWRDYGILSVGEEPTRLDYMGCKFDVEVLA